MRATLPLRLVMIILLCGYVGRKGEILLRFDQRQTLCQSLLERCKGVAAKHDPLWRRILVDAVDHYLDHPGGIAKRKARRILKDTMDHSCRSALVRFHLRADLCAAEPELCACPARL